MRVLVTGAKGQLGREIARQAGGYYDLTLTDRNALDITDQRAVFTCLRAWKPEVVIHCAAYTDVDRAESNEDEAYRINVDGTGNIVLACAEIGARIVYLSTDYVFDGGKKQSYRESDAVNPLNVYGKTKQQSEEVVRQALSRHYIVRTAWLYGDGNNFVRTMFNLAMRQSVLRVVNDQIGTPTSTADLTRALFRIIASEHYGTYHATCQGQCSWYDFACEIFRQEGKTVDIVPVSTAEFCRPARRPANSVLDNSRLRALGDPMRDWQEALKEYLTTYRQPELTPSN